LHIVHTILLLIFFSFLIGTGGRKKNIPFRRQRMEIDCILPSPETAPADSLTAPSADPYVADLLKVADDSIARLREEARNLTDDKLGLEAKMSNLRKQVRTISRCNMMALINSVVLSFIFPATSDDLIPFLILQ